MMASRGIFLDSSFIVGLTLPDDALYDASQKLFLEIKDKFDVFLINNYILAEVVTVVGRKSGKERALSIAEMLMSQELKLIQIEKQYDELSLKILEETTHKIGFVDASIIATMKLEGCRHMISFDQQLVSLAKKNRFKTF